MSRVAQYSRVSTNRQTTASQKPALDAYCKQFDSVRRFEDKSTGKNFDRPAWIALEAAIDRGEIDTVVVWRLDRLGRNSAKMAALFEKLVRLNVRLISVTEGLDLSTPIGRMMATIFSSMAVYENEVRSERIIAGQQAAIKAGKVVHHGRKPGSRSKCSIEKEQSIKALHKQGVNVSAIARTVGLSRQTVYTYLSK